MRKTKIVCTIGPASESIDKLVSLMEAGMNVARLNFSHGDFEEHGARIVNIRKASEMTGKTVAILLDTKGPEIRTQTLENGVAELKAGQQLVISMTEVVGNSEKISITYPELVHDVKVGSKILLDDGLIELEVAEILESAIVTKVLNSGVLKNKKGVNVPNVSVNLPGITDKDAADIKFGIEQNVDFVAASFVRRAADVLQIRELLESNNGSHVKIIPKIENQEGVDNIDEILQVSDGLMVARGDLGVEIPVEEVPLVQKMLIKKCNAEAKPVITATQMLDSMQRNPRPTRAEASDVANAIFDGTDAIMLSGETAAGDYPIDAVKTMDKIAARTEKSLNYKAILSKKTKEEEAATTTSAIGQSVVHTASNLNSPFILSATESGYTAHIVSKYRPKADIIAVTSNEHIVRQLSLAWGVYPVLGEKAQSTDHMLETTVEAALKTGVIKQGERVVITAGVPVGESGTTNLIKVHVIGEVVAKGQGIGKSSVTGKIVIAHDAAEANEKVQEGSILVTQSTDKDMIPAFEKAAAVITEEGGLTSHAAVVGISLNTPVVVGVDGALTLFAEGDEVTVDSTRGDIYRGHASVL
ncbi:pyruvate kinase [Alkalihalobacillus trypoxylicola]|uniref:Pyruvate kinase n=1 Tax=Alkalihalobacillus trypoxylicola TaxID=519424 RepID=A0A161PG82_9BACI|nr:pyruvate kinase [Alkalihalobacillus trypoxylicola]KYG32197.1 pyruvate kinase [Alkalihalobacillus trypoxylicola]